MIESMSCSRASRFSSGGWAGFAFWRLPSGLVGVTRFLANGEKGLFSVTLRLPARAVFQWSVLDMAKEGNGAKARGKKNAKKVPELLIREKKEMFVGKFFRAWWRMSEDAQ